MRYKLRTLSILLLFTIVIFSCSGSDSEKKAVSLKKGDYLFVLTDSSGNTLADGVLKIEMITEDNSMPSATHLLSGSYNAKRYVDENDTNFVGITTLNGGSIKGWWNNKNKTIYINTNPMLADANVYFSAVVGRDGIMEGNWIFSTFRNTRSGEGGFFRATKK